MNNFGGEELVNKVGEFYNDNSNPKRKIGDIEYILGDKEEQSKRGNNFYIKGGNTDFNNKKKQQKKINNQRVIKGVAKRTAAMLTVAAMGIGTYNAIQNTRKLQNEKILAEKNFAIYMENRTENVSEYTKTDLDEFKAFSISVMDIDRYDGSDDESKMKKKNAETVTVDYVRSYKLEKTADKLMDMKMRDAMYYGDYSNVNLYELKNNETVEVEIWERVNEMTNSKIIVEDLKGISFFKKLLPINNDREKNVTSEFGDFMDSLVELKCRDKWSDKKCINFAKDFYKKMALVADKRYILDKNGNLKEISKEEFDGRVVKREKDIPLNNNKQHKDHNDR